MPVTEHATMEQVRQDPQQQLTVGSAAGAVALLAGLWLVFAGIPTLWGIGWATVFADNAELKTNEFLSDALLILVDVCAIGGLAFGAFRGARKLVQPGLRAGMVFAAVMLFAALAISAWLGSVMDNQFQDQLALGWIVLGAIFGAMIGGAGFLYLKIPGWLAFLETTEHQGWFHAVPYKGNQGVRVRRGTIMGVLAVGVCGIIHMVSHQYFGIERPATNELARVANDWFWYIPYSDQTLYIPLLYKVHMLMPIILGVLLIWFAWRIVNVPTFADFLIATEAEMNKVSWTNRQRLMKDTVVVLTTVVLMTAFLFVVDILWIKVLSAPGIQVLLINPKEAQQKQQETAKW